MEVTLISTLPPIIGLSPYTRALTECLSENIKIRFLGFRHIYPQWLYPGTISDPSLKPLSEHQNLKIRNILNWYNPIQWIIEAFRIQTGVIHAQWWSFPLAPIYWIILGINGIRGKKIILTIHNIIPHERSLLKRFLNFSVYNLAHEYIVHTENNRDILRHFVKTKPIHIIPHGLIQPPQIGLTKDAARKKIGIPADSATTILLCFGHIRDYKGLDTALESLSAINDSNVKLLIAGNCWENWAKYQTLINQYNLSDRIIRKEGFIPDDEVEALFKASDIVLLPYKHFDAQSGVGTLLLSFNSVAIVSRTGGLTEYVPNSQYVCTPSNPSDLAQRIMAVRNNFHQSEEDFKNYFELKRKDLDWKVIAKKTIDIYKSM